MNNSFTCVDCQKVETVEDGEIKWLQEKGFELYKRCSACRRAKKRRFENFEQNTDYKKEVWK